MTKKKPITHVVRQGQANQKVDSLMFIITKKQIQEFTEVRAEGSEKESMTWLES